MTAKSAGSTRAVSTSASEAKPLASRVVFQDEFEAGTEEDLLPGWYVHPETGFRAVLSRDAPRSGRQCVALHREAEGEPGFGNLARTLDAEPLRDRRVRFRAAIRVGACDTDVRAQMWMRVDLRGGGVGFFDNMDDRPITSEEWGDYEIVGRVDRDADRIWFGVIVLGIGSAWVDEMTFEVLGEERVEAAEPPRPLTRAGERNLIAFTRLLGYVRYFHPSDEASATDWNTFAIDGVRAIEGARGASGLAQALQDLFRPVAPTVRVFPTAQPASLPAELSPPADLAGLEAVRWHHQGLGVGAGIYDSERQRVAVARSGLRRSWRSPAKPFRADLGSGVSCLVPLTLYADAEGTLPHTPAAPEAPPEEPAVALLRSGNSRATRLAAVALSWNVPQHFYPYFDVVRTDWPRALARALRAAAVDAGEREFLDTLRVMVAALKDGHGRVSHPCDRDFFAPPICLDVVEGRVVVTHVAPDGPRTVRRGDEMLAVDGEPVARVLRRLKTLISSATPQWMQVRALRQLLAGPEGTVVKVTLSRGGGELRAARLRRTARSYKVAEPLPDRIAELQPGLLYVDLGRVAQSDWDEALPALSAAQAIVLDLRTYPYRGDPAIYGHFTNKALHSPQWHMPVFTQPDRVDMTFRVSDWAVPPVKPRLRAKLALLTGGGAISAAEQWVAMFRHYELGEIVGGPTAGTNGNINPFTVPGGYRICWTGLKVLKHDGSQHHGVGILPTVPVSRTLAGVAVGRDEVLERAVELLLEPRRPADAATGSSSRARRSRAR